MTFEKINAILGKNIRGGLSMNYPNLKILEEIGTLLDQDRYEEIVCCRTGVVRPRISLLTPNKEQYYERENFSPTQRPNRPSTGPWAGSTERQRQTNRPGASLQASPVILDNLSGIYKSELAEVLTEFPNTKIWEQEDGMWLITESRLLPEFWLKAKFIIWIPYSRTILVRGWGFWDGILLEKPKWIGPRHTNFDGSICAFEISDETWVAGMSINELLRYYSLWAIRHLHLNFFGRWPGHQAVHTPIERLRELHHNEYCGCDNSVSLYNDCCYRNDLEFIRSKNLFNLLFSEDKRHCPNTIYNFLLENNNPPCSNNISNEIVKIFYGF